MTESKFHAFNVFSADIETACDLNIRLLPYNPYCRGRVKRPAGPRPKALWALPSPLGLVAECVRRLRVAIYTIVEGQGIKGTIKLPPPSSR
jgi:hypothetical protein